MNELLEKAKAGDIDAYSKLMISIKPELEKVANKTLIDKSYVDDVLQSIYYKAYKKLDTLRDNEKFKSWILTAVRNESLNVNKYVARHREVSLSDFEEMLVDSSSNDFDSSMNFEQIISELSDEEKVLLRMKFEENYKNAEIAEKLGIPYNTVKSKINRAIKKITLVALVLVMLSGFTALATFVIKQIRAHFTTSLNAINTAVENDYVQEIDSDFVYDNGIGIKVDAIVLDDKNLDISFVYDVQDKEKYGEITGIGILDYVIKSDDEVLFDTKVVKGNLIKTSKQISHNFEVYDNKFRNSVLYSVLDGYDLKNINKLIIEISTIYINANEEISFIDGKWNMSNDVIDKLNERYSNNYIIEENPYVKDASVTLIDTAIQFEIEFYNEIEENYIFDISLCSSNNEFKWIGYELLKNHKMLKITFDVGKYTEDINELTLKIPTKNDENIILTFRREQ